MFGRMLKTLTIAIPVLMLLGCAYPIKKEYREEARKDVTFGQVLQNPSAYKGSTVIWGGTIIQTTPQSDGTEIMVLETPLERQERPQADRYSQGRFIVRSPKFLDPEIYKNGMKVTVAGQIVGQEAKPLGQVQYNYPLVEAREIHLWTPETSAYNYMPYPYWYGWAPSFWDDWWY